MSEAIRTPDQRLRIFVSSTLQELGAEREAAKRAIEHICLTPVMFELGARAHPPRDLYRAYLAQSDVFIGIYWQSYGWVAPEETISGLEDEYVLAREKPKLIYIKRSEAREERLKGLITRIRQEDGVSYRAFKDAAELEQLVKEDLALLLTERFAAAATQSTPVAGRSVAPVERGGLIGREKIITSLSELLLASETGCLTLTGPGGTGKTRLAIHAANALAEHFPDGVFYIPLAAVRLGSEVLPTLQSALELPATGASAESIVAAFLRPRRALVVLDNFEQVLDAANNLGRLLAACPQLKLLVTSREALRIQSERELPVPPLDHQMIEQTVTPAMQLFQERAREVRPDFAIDDGNRATVAEICRRLDALPLAIELAAARVRVLSPEAMLQRLDKSLMLTGDRRDLPARHQALRATLDWSYQLLAPGEQIFFRRLGIFADSFPEEGAAAVVGDDALDGLTSLVEKSLLVRADESGQARFHMLATVREFARERLAEAGEERDSNRRLATWVTRLLARAYDGFQRASTRARTETGLTAEEGNVRSAWSFLVSEDDDREQAWQFFCHLSWVRHLQFRVTEIRSSYEALRRRGDASDPLVAAVALGMVAWADLATPSSRTLQDLADSVGVLEAHGERRFLPGIVLANATVSASLDPARALAAIDRALTLSVEGKLHPFEAWARLQRCLHLMTSGQLELADHAADELISSSTLHEEEDGIVFGMTSKARLSLLRGDLTLARETFARATAYARSSSSIYGRADALTGLASVALAQEDEVAAHTVIVELVRLAGRHNAAMGAELAWGALAYLLAKSGDEERARRVLEVIPRGVENPPPALRLQFDPTGSLARATRDARSLLGDPQPLRPENVDLEATLSAALGSNEHAHNGERINQPAMACQAEVAPIAASTGGAGTRTTSPPSQAR
jgi:predicted ATPase